MADEYYPPGAFYFAVYILGSGTAFSLLTDIDASFQEVSGIRAELGIEEVTEGGENRFVHRLPRPAKYSNLVLKRGVVTMDSVLAEWVGQTVGSGLALPILTQNLLVTLLGEDGFPRIAWLFVNAYPVKWDVAPLSSEDNKVLTETMEFAYNYFERFNLGSGLSAVTKLAQVAAKLI
jgi:phage tail-like protein